MASQPQQGATPYDLIGGAPVIRRIVDRFYDLMDQDPAYAELRALHAPDLGPMRHSLSGFLNAWAGGPRDWFEENPGKCMMSAHKGIAIAPATAANSPMWCTHLVGVNISTNMVAKMTPIRRQAGPRATPGTRLRRSMMNIEANSDSAVIRKPNRRDSEPSTVGRIR